MFDEIREWLAVVLGAIAALFSWLNWFLARRAVGAYCELLIEGVAGNEVSATLRIDNATRRTFVVKQIRPRRPGPQARPEQPEALKFSVGDGGFGRGVHCLRSGM